MAGNDTKETILKGTSASLGIACGKAFVAIQKELFIPIYKIKQDQRDQEVKRFQSAVEGAKKQLKDLTNKITQSLGKSEGYIFETHLLAIQDKNWITETTNLIKKQYHNAEYAFYQTTQHFQKVFENLEDPYLKERSRDIKDVAKRIQNILIGEADEHLVEMSRDQIITSEDISPSEAASMSEMNILGVALEQGSQASHAIIIARSIKIPVVIGIKQLKEHIQHDQFIIVDGYQGLVILNPLKTTLKRYHDLQKKKALIDENVKSHALEPAVTKDGKNFHIVANINNLTECDRALEFGAEGIGLYRTENLFMFKETMPLEEEQYKIYKQIAEKFYPHSVNIRTLDLGGDKAFYKTKNEENSFLGCRAIRFCLKHPEFFKNQLKAILRANTKGNIKIIYPMITNVNELIEANNLLDICKKELREKGAVFEENISIGVMIEVPSAAINCDLLSEHCDFFSIGTNDLTQYLLAVDRSNIDVADLYNPLDLAVLRILKHVIEVGENKGLEVSICGEMVANPIYTPLLIGLGVSELSATPTLLPHLKSSIRSWESSTLKALAQEILTLKDSKEIENRLIAFNKKYS